MRVNGTELHVLDVGDGAPALVFLHYWGGSSRTWAPVMEHLSVAQRCVAIDFRGWGLSSKSSTDHSLETLASDVLGVTDKLGLADFDLVGHSMGGKVAQLVAARHPPGLRGLILYAPAPPAPMAVAEEMRRRYVELYQSRQGAEMVLGNLTPHRLSDVYREQVITDTLRGSPAAKEAWPLQGMITDVRAETSRITVPVHIISGADDAVEPEAALRAAFGEVLADVSFTVIPGVGHIAPLEAPAAVADAISAAQRA